MTWLTQRQHQFSFNLEEGLRIRYWPPCYWLLSLQKFSHLTRKGFSEKLQALLVNRDSGWTYCTLMAGYNIDLDSSWIHHILTVGEIACYDIARPCFLVDMRSVYVIIYIQYIFLTLSLLRATIVVLHKMPLTCD